MNDIIVVVTGPDHDAILVIVTGTEDGDEARAAAYKHIYDIRPMTHVVERYTSIPDIATVAVERTVNEKTVKKETVVEHPKTAHQIRQDEKKADFIDKLAKVSPVFCEFRVGDVVTFMNEAGIVFPDMVVVGFGDPEDLHGRFIHLDKEAYWFPLYPSELTLQYRAVAL